jgi:hypothetical protein
VVFLASLRAAEQLTLDFWTVALSPITLAMLSEQARTLGVADAVGAATVSARCGAKRHPQFELSHCESFLFWARKARTEGQPRLCPVISELGPFSVLVPLDGHALDRELAERTGLLRPVIAERTACSRKSIRLLRAAPRTTFAAFSLVSVRPIPLARCAGGVPVDRACLRGCGSGCQRGVAGGGG